MRYLLPFALLFAAVPALAQGPYAGGGLFAWSYDEDGMDALESTGFFIRGGYEVNPYFALEGRFAAGGEDDVWLFVPGYGSVNAELELDHAISLLAKPQLPLTEQFRLYGLLGYTRGELTISALGTSVSDDDSGMSYGVGAEFAVTDRFWLTGDWANYLHDDAYDFTALSLGARVTF